MNRLLVLTTRWLSLSLALILGQAALADGLADLREALTRYPATSVIKATAEAKTWKRDGDGKDVDEKTGVASMQFEEGPLGVRMQYSRDTVNRYAADEQIKEKDAKARTPTLSALGALNMSELRQLANGVPVLSRQLDRSTFKSEKTDVWNGKPARLLSFDYGIGSLSEKDRKYVKQYEGSLEVWIAADGTPLASRTHQTVGGRAYVVVSFSMKNDEDVVYVPVGDRLTVARKDTRSEGSGAGEHGESRTTRSLMVH